MKRIVLLSATIFYLDIFPISKHVAITSHLYINTCLHNFYIRNSLQSSNRNIEELTSLYNIHLHLHELYRIYQGEWSTFIMSWITQARDITFVKHRITPYIHSNVQENGTTKKWIGLFPLVFYFSYIFYLWGIYFFLLACMFIAYELWAL